jgi:hypothetical protein
LGLGAIGLTGGLLAPEIGGLFGAGAAADSLGGAAAAGVASDFGGAAAAAPTALGFAGDPFSAATFAPSTDLPSAITSGFSGATPTAELPSVGSPSLASSVSAAVPDWSVPSLGNIPDFGQASAFAGAPNATPFDPGLGGFEGNINTAANPSFSAPGANLSPAAGAQPGSLATSVSNALGGAISPQTASTIGQIGGPAIGLGGLGYNLYSGYQQKQQLQQLTQQEQQQAQQAQQVSQAEQAAAQPLLSQGNTLISYLTTNTLPPQFQAQIQQTVAAQKAQIIQGYATRGMSTNPQQNSALAQDLANVDTQTQSLQANLESTLATAGTQLTQQANALLQSGMNATELSARIPIMVQELNAQLGQQTSQAISSFASAFGGGNSSGQSFKIVSAAA